MNRESQEDVERRIAKMTLNTSRSLDERILAFADGVQVKRGGGLSLVGGLRVAVGFVGAGALAAAVLLAVLFSRSAKWGGEEAQGAEVVRRAVEESKRAQIVHTKVKNSDGTEVESWYSVNPVRLFTKRPGRITLEDPVRAEGHVYEKAAGTLTIKSLYRPRHDLAAGAASIFDAMMTSFEKGMVEISTGYEQLDGKRLQLVVGRLRGGVYRVFIDPEAKRIVRREFEQEYADGSVRTSVSEIDYPERMPADVYALGVPRDAQVVDKRVPGSVDLLRKAWAARNSFDPEYFAIICSSTRQQDGSYSRDGFCQVYKKDDRFRVERYEISHAPFARRRELFEALASDEMAVLEGALAAMKPFEVYIGKVTAYGSKLFRRPYETGKLTVTDNENLWMLLSPEAASWGLPDGLNMITAVEETDGLFGKLKGLVETYQGGIWKGRITNVPMRRWHFLNPEKDFVREEYLSLTDGRAPWQEDSQWLDGIEGAEEARAKKREHALRVVEYARTSSGKWYARKIVTEYRNLANGSTNGSLKLILVDATREVPMEVFDLSGVKDEDILE